ncbi:MAG: class II aldolase, partial [Proteobacteria bacterium]|nr:class II aldolase [Pseudomonadota bacterium]
LSFRVGDRFIITPSGLHYDEMQADDLVEVSLSTGKVIGGGKPSTEWRFHRDILASRDDVDVVLHAHAVFCTALACQQREIPAFHYMVAAAGGKCIRCADYALFGTQELSTHVLQALGSDRACLMANHGMIALGKSLKSALALAVEVETLAAQYVRALQIGEPVLLSDKQMDEVIDAFSGYGADS